MEKYRGLRGGLDVKTPIVPATNSLKNDDLAAWIAAELEVQFNGTRAQIDRCMNSIMPKINEWASRKIDEAQESEPDQSDTLRDIGRAAAGR